MTGHPPQPAVPVAAATCPGCGASVHVFAHQLLSDVPPTAHAAVAQALAQAEEGGSGAPARFGLAEGDGSYVCPACGRLDWVPLTIDLD